MTKLLTRDFGALKTRNGIHWWKSGITESSSKEEILAAFLLIKERLAEIHR